MLQNHRRAWWLAGNWDCKSLQCLHQSNHPLVRAVNILTQRNRPNRLSRKSLNTHYPLRRVKPIDPAAPKPRFQLSDGSVDLTKSFSLGGFEGVGGSWKLPPADDTFDARYGQW